MRQRRVKKKSSILLSCNDYIFISPDIVKPSILGYLKPAYIKRLSGASDAFSASMTEDPSGAARPAAGPDAAPPEESYDFRGANGIPENMPVYIEIGSGKGQFLTQKALLEPNNYYLACEGGSNIYIRVLQKARKLELKNFKLINEYIVEPAEWFPENSLDGIYINFCDPWPKKRHAHRRLTHRRLLEQYIRIAKPGACLEFKTDNDALFEWSLEEFEAAGLLPALEQSRDLWRSEYAGKNIRTEYEDRFGGAGKGINYIKLQLKPASF